MCRTARLLARDSSLWTGEDEGGWLGWLDTVDEQLARLPALKGLSREIGDGAFSDAVLLGMGGSSLAPEVMQAVLGAAPGALRLHVLDSTDPAAVLAVAAAVDLDQTLFNVASKSGGTIEVMSLFAHFWKLVTKAKGNHGGKQFVAITDPGTGLETMARDYGFSQIFSNPPDIGGRYSVLSLFGLVPAALLGVNIAKLLDRAAGMAERCRLSTDIRTNPGAYLGAAMGSLAKAGRDKVTVIASPSLATFGLWVEQLLAESTGKEGTGLIPIAQEPVLKPAAYGADRFFVSLKLKGEKNAALDQAVQTLIKAGQPVLRFDLRDHYDLGAEFFRWEFATAVAGHLLAIQPFDQPNVQESKDNTNRVLDTFQSTGRLPRQPNHQPKEVAKALSGLLQPGTYLSVLGYTTPTRPLEAAVGRLRRALMSRYRVATTFGYGPRYLHSTGQLHKGGPSTGVFLELVDRMAPDVPIPGRPFSFGTLANAQASGDLESLRSHHRQAIRVQLGRDPVAVVNAIAAAVAGTASSGPRTGTTKRRRKTRR